MNHLFKQEMKAYSFMETRPTFQTPDALLQGVQIHGSSRAMQLHAPLLTKARQARQAPRTAGKPISMYEEKLGISFHSMSQISGDLW